MGHYASEMQCDTCGMMRCRCIVKPTDEKLDHFVVDWNFTICTVYEFLERHNGEWNAPSHLQFKEKFKRREDAEVSARLACEAAVESARAELLRLKRVCITERPWEQK